jgi:dTDP-4-dehydrorhamnose reductase
MATILVTGSDGQLGMELRRLASSYAGYEFIFTDVNSLDITSLGEVNEFVKEKAPDWIVNCAAYTAVDKAEDDSAGAFAVNSTGVRNLIAAIRDTRCRFVHISTDYVFDGSRNTPYSEADETSPVTEYGKSKLAGEKEALVHPETLIIRTSWLYSAYGANFVRTMLRLLSEGKNPLVVIDQTGSPTWAEGLASTIMSIIAGVIRNKIPFVPGIYNYSDEGVCSWYDVAITIADCAGEIGRISPCLSDRYPQKARRPSYSVLDKQKIKETYNISIPHWRENLITCLKQLI